MEILDCSMASKKVTQCSAIIIPAIKNLKKLFKVIINLSFFINKKTNVSKKATNIRCQTNSIEPIVIASPSIAVKPAINTKKCRCK
jgi:hypothetical protein